MAPVSMKLYKALGVAADADDNTIKKAYKKGALKWHPDRNQDSKEDAEAKFKEISEAYEVLIDPKQRRLYDQVGEDYKNAGQGGGGAGFSGFPGGGGFGGGDGAQQFRFSSGGGGGEHDPREIFKQFFGAGFDPSSGSYDDDDPFASFGGMGGGGMRSFNFGGMPGMRQQQGGMAKKPKGATREFKVDCTLEELYAGCTKKRKLTRKRVQGGKLVDVAKVVEIHVQPGWKSGTKVTFAGEGDEAPNESPGDIVFVINEKPHKEFTRQDNDLVYQPTLKKDEAHAVSVPVLGSDKPVKVRVPAGAAKTPLPEKGMPRRKSGKVIGHGDIHIKPKWT